MRTPKSDRRSDLDPSKVPPHSKAAGANPKDLVAAQKVSFTKLPFVGVIHGAMAMMDGAAKYGPYNWRAKKVMASIYVDACMRHLAAWFEGQEHASDSGVHHLGHAIACCAILLDAQARGCLVDDRPVVDWDSKLDWIENLLKTLHNQKKGKQCRKKS